LTVFAYRWSMILEHNSSGRLQAMTEATMSDVRWSEHDAPAQLSSARKAELAEVLCALLDGTDRARLVELHYWSEEPQLLDIMRIVVGLSEETRAALHTFLTRAADPQKITGTAETSGELLLSGPVHCAAVLPFRPPRK
jgi:hypothetical protein